MSSVCQIYTDLSHFLRCIKFLHQIEWFIGFLQLLTFMKLNKSLLLPTRISVPWKTGVILSYTVVCKGLCSIPDCMKNEHGNFGDKCK